MIIGLNIKNLLNF